MAYADNAKKFVCVLNGSRPIGPLMNALAQATGGLAAKLEAGEADFLDYANHADGFRATISRYPYIVLKAKNGSQLASLRKAADEVGLTHNVFVSAMVGESAEEQLAKTAAATGANLEYWAVTLFGDAATINPLTKKFSLFSAPAAATESV